MRVFDYLTGGGGFQFPCDERGQVLEDQLSPAAADNLRRCLSRYFRVVDRGIVQVERMASPQSAGGAEAT